MNNQQLTQIKNSTLLKELERRMREGAIRITYASF
jgi:hypothetical protein